MRNVTVALIQNSLKEKSEENLSETLLQIEKAAQAGANIVCTQELFQSAYFPQSENHDYFSLAEDLSQKSEKVQMLSEVARMNNVVLVASLFEKRTEGIYHNTAICLDSDGAYLGKYRKLHIPDDPQFYEKFYFTEGDLGYQVFDTNFGKVGVLICWDQWYPEAARMTALSGAEMIFYPTAIGWLPEEKAVYGADQLKAWQTIQTSHAIANGCYIASVNRCGVEANPQNADEKIEFWGNSFVVNPAGKVVASAGTSETLLLAELDLDLINETRITWPFFRDRRIDTYSALTKRFNDHL